MITAFIIKLAAGLITALFSIIPAWGIDTSSVQAVDGTVTGVASLNGWVPEQMAFICLGIAVGVRLFFLAWSGILFVYRLVPFNG